MTPPTFCRSCREAHFGPDLADDLCPDCRRQLAEAEAAAAAREAHQQRAAERARAMEPATIPDETFPW